VNAIILAAGRGSRLGRPETEAPKCLLPVGASTLLERQIASISAHGVREVIVVTGFAGDRVRTRCGAGVRYIDNPVWRTTDSLYSLWLARDYLAHGSVIFNADVLFHPNTLGDLLTARHDDAILISSTHARCRLGNEEMKVVVRQGRVVEIGKGIAPERADAENVGIAKFGPAGGRLLGAILDELVARGHTSEWVPRAFSDFAVRRDLCVVDTRGFPWVEIDFPDDYSYALTDVLPAIEPECA
jgi:choline kinase